MKTIHNRIYGGIPLGFAIRGSIANTTTFRVRRGNGHYTSILGAEYQDQYAYFVPSSINNVQSEPYRQQWKAAVHKWKYDLTADEKKAYNIRAHRTLRMSGYNLFMREAMKGLVQMFVDRGDPAAVDKVKTDLTTDAAWNDLDLSAIVPAGAAAVLLKTRLQSADPGDKIRYRKKGNTNEINACGCEALRANVLRTRMGITAIDANRVIQYNADNIVWTQLDIVVRGWWT
jgi:hypothetical protein